MYACSSCGFASQTKLGKCPDCGSFGTFEKDSSIGTVSGKATKKQHLRPGSVLGKPYFEDKKRSVGEPNYQLKNSELLRIFPQGINQSGIYLLGGEPGIGKSTIALQLLHDLKTNNDLTIAYYSGEETSGQIEKRSERIFSKQLNEGLGDIYHTTHLEDIITTTDSNGYNFIVIDSIQTIYSESIDGIAGSPSQVKHCSEKLSEYCKGAGVTCLIIGHVTKEGEIA